MVKRVMKYFVLLLLLSINLSAQSISVLASIVSSDYLVGDYINYTLEIRAQNNIELTTPIIRDSLKKVEIIKEISPLFKDEGTIKVSTFGYIISYYDSASITDDLSVSLLPRGRTKTPDTDGGNGGGLGVAQVRSERAEHAEAECRLHSLR